MQDPLVTVRGLRTQFPLDEGTVHAVDGVDLTVPRGRTLCVVGESGCGKSITAFSIMRMLASPGRIVDGTITLHHPVGSQVVLTDLAEDSAEMRAIRGRDVAMVFQEPMTSLSPVHTVGSQIAEAVLLHTDEDKEGARRVAIDTMRRVGIPDPERRFGEYPHELSGGLRQRAMIAMALSCQPALLIADEPTTALDVTIQAQILDLMRDLRSKTNTAIILITHDLGVVAEQCDRVAVMYAGQVVESGPVATIIGSPAHPYTRGLLQATPRVENLSAPVRPIPGTVPSLVDLPAQCRFLDRCTQATSACRVLVPMAHHPTEHRVRCVQAQVGSEAT
jgi:peptide/nickel transport system ATP-binding protein